MKSCLKITIHFIFMITVFFQAITIARPQTTAKYWIFFKDKGPEKLHKSQHDYSFIESNISEKALKRRLKVSKAGQPFDFSDLPICESYLNQLFSQGFEIISRSNWLNAVSTRLSSVQMKKLESYQFIKKIQQVCQFRRKPEPVTSGYPIASQLFKSANYDLKYGGSLTQNALMHVPEVHNLGINGTNVIIGLLDTGFNYRRHGAFAYINVIGEYDFINRDSVTQNENNEIGSNQHDHGTTVMATIGAFQENYLIGPAYRANYLLAKTEDRTHEDIIEEDYWVAGLEWLERSGADIVSSSLGYDSWYTFEQMDGNTAITTIAADIAVKKGVAVFNSMGNEGNHPGSIIVPADADSVISVGSVTSKNTLSYFSSTGPTADQRIKPDVVALGSKVLTVAPNSSCEFIYKNGTSFACPLAAGAAALILSAHPELTPIQLREALRMTADRADNPGMEYGWGLVNALEGVLYHGLVFSNLPVIQQSEGRNKLIKIKIQSKYGINPDSVNIFFSVTPDSFVKSRLRHTGIPHEYGADFSFDGFDEIVYFYFSAVDSTGIKRHHPWNAPVSVFNTEGWCATEPLIPCSFLLYPNYPNPFDRITNIQYDLPSASQVLLEIYNIRGRLVKKLVDQYQSSGHYQASWDGRNSAGQLAANGVYEVRFHAAYYSARRMIDLIRMNPLRQNHPNPFNQSTTIEFELYRTAKVKLRIFNLTGQLTVVLIDKIQKPDTYKIQWDGRDNQGCYVSSGVYFYELQTDNLRTVRKMLCLR